MGSAVRKQGDTKGIDAARSGSKGVDEAADVAGATRKADAPSGKDPEAPKGGSGSGSGPKGGGGSGPPKQPAQPPKQPDPAPPKAADCKANSFTPHTGVVMADGSAKAIEDVEVGDEVLATDPKTGKAEARPVLALITGVGVKDLVEVTVDTDGDKGDDTGTVVATDGHPFWVENLGAWVDAKDLRPGDMLRTSAGTWVQVQAVHEFQRHQRVHNLTVAGIHTYHVKAGETPVLVHNVGGLDGCSDAAYQGVLHIREEAAKEAAEGGARNHHFDMSDDQLADYLDRFAGRADGAPLKRGGVGWYDAELGVTVIPRRVLDGSVPRVS